MAAATLKISRPPAVVIDNLQHSQEISCQMVVIPGTGYEVGGIPFDSVILKQSGVQTNSGVREALIWSTLGTGYIYQRSPTGNLIILQVPPTGSLTTAAPLQQLSSAAGSLSEVQNDILQVKCWVNRNS